MLTVDRDDDIITKSAFGRNKGHNFGLQIHGLNYIANGKEMKMLYKMKKNARKMLSLLAFQ